MPTRERTHPTRRTPSTFGHEEEPAEVDPGRVWLALALGALAVILSAGALAISLLRSDGSATDCQTLAWDSIPEAADLPDGWAVTTSDFIVGSLIATVDGPASADATSDASIFATVTCYAGDAVQALARSRAAEAATGSTIESLDLGDDGYQVGSESAGTTAVHFLRNDLVTHLEVSGSVDQGELMSVAEAFDTAIRTAQPGSIPTPGAGGQATAPPLGSVEPTDDFPLESDLPAESPAAPELEAMMPKVINGQTFVINSATGADLPADSPGSRALMASLRASDKTAADLQVAEAYDEAETLDLYLLGFRLPDGDGEELRDLVLDSWLAANVTGVTQETVTFGDRELIRVSYGDDQPDVYLYTREDAVILIHTLDAALAEAAAAALP